MLKLSFKATRQATSAADAAGSGSTTPDPATPDPATPGSAPSAADDTGSAEDTGVRDTADIEFDEAVKSATGPKGRFEALRKARGAKRLGAKDLVQLGVSADYLTGDVLRGAAALRDIDSDDIGRGITSLEIQDSGDAKVKRGFTFAGAGLDALKIDEGLRNIQRKIDAAEDAEDTQARENESVIEGKKNRLLKLDYLLRQSGSALKKDPKTKMYSFVPGKQNLGPKFTEDEERIVRAIIQNEKKALAGSGIVAPTRTDFFGREISENPMASLVRLYNKLQTEINRREKSVAAFQEKQKQLGAAQSRFRSQLKSLVTNMTPEEKKAYKEAIKKRDAEKNKESSK
tara:strand:- start:2309 stop:3340 length:1032 start_codon:yes stop_codon:yes gene_type:complete